MTSRTLERSKQARDSAIRKARLERIPFREIAAAAGLGITRVQQIAGGAPAGDYPARDAISEVDTLGWTAGADADVDQEDRVVALATVAPWLETWPSERAFIQARSERALGQHYDLSFRILDLEPFDEWVVAYIASTGEVYAFAARPSPVVGRGTSPDEDLRLGSTSGPCKLLGHAFSYKLLDAAIGNGISAIAYRPGGLAWCYGRVALLNRILDTLPLRAEGVNDYLASLPSNERPR